MSSSRSVYISYSWGAEKRQPLVDELLAALKAKGIEVKRDSNAINYGDSIRAYMDELAAGGAIILVLSEEYFKSPNCMYELREIYLNSRKEFRKRIFPVVLKDSPLHSPEDQILYIDYWENKTKEFDNNLDMISKRNVSHDLLSKLKDYDDFAKMIGDLQSLISDMYCPKEEELRKTGFSALIERIFSHNPPSGGGGTDKTIHEKAVGNQSVDIDQNIVGNGNISSASGNITIGNVTIYAAGTAPQPEKTDFPVSSFKPGTLFNVPDPPPNYFARPDDLKEFRAALLAEGTQVVGITGKAQYIGVQGMGGLGKSVLAAAVAHDEKVRAAFPDGIFWLRFRQHLDNAYLLEHQKELLHILAPCQEPKSLVHGENLLNLALQDKRCLFIADDLWDSKHLRHFNVKSSGCRFLLTTRNAEVIKKTGARRCELGLLSDTQARELLAQCSGYTENDLPDEAAEILHECGRLPLAVAAVGSMVRDEPAEYWRLVLQRLQNARIDKIPADFNDNYDYENLFKVFQVSVEALPKEVQELYKTLAVFHEDELIPLSVLQLYWKYCGSEEHESLVVVSMLVKRSLLTRLDDNLYSLHDLLRDYLMLQSDGDISKLHKQLLEAYNEEYPGGWHTIPYIYIEKNYSFTQKGYTHFCMAWYYHAREVNDPVYAAKIADDLIRNQPLLEMACLKLALGFVDYKLDDIAPRLLEINKDISVLKECLELLGSSAKKDDVLLVLKEMINTGDVLGSENKKVIILCLEILEKEAREEIKRLLEKNIDADIIYRCLKILGEDGKEYTWRFLRGTKNFGSIHKYLFLLGEEAKEYAENLLKDTDDEFIKWTCINFLGKDAKDDALYLVKNSQNKFIQRKCQKLIDSWEQTDLAE